MSVCMQSSTRVLYIDDDPEDLVIFRYEMAESGFDGVTSFVPKDNAREVVAYLEENKGSLPDVILVDIRMPCVDGIEILAQIRDHQEFGRIPVVLISNSKDSLESIQRRHSDFKVQGFLLKPVSVRELISVLDPFSRCLQGQADQSQPPWSADTE